MSSRLPTAPPATAPPATAPSTNASSTNVPPTTASSTTASSTASNGALVRRLLAFSWRYRWGCVQLLVLQACLLLTALGALQLGGIGIDVVRFHLGHYDRLPDLPGGIPLPRDWRPMSQVWLLAAAILFMGLARALLNYLYAVASGKLIHERIVVDLRAQVYDQLQRLSFRFFDANASGSLINRVTGDVQAVRAFVDGVIVQFVVLLLSLVFYLVYMFRLHVGLTLACLATTPLLWWLSVRFSRQVRPEYDRNRDLVDRMVLRLTETLQGVQVVKGFGREPEEIARFRDANREIQEQQHNVFWKVTVFSPVVQLLTQFNLVVLLAYGGYLVSVEQLSLGTGLVVFAGLLQQFSSQVGNLSTIANSIQQSLSGARRVFEILDTPVEVRSPAEPTPLPRVRGDVRFEQVTFGYRADSPVLHEVSLDIPAGRTVAVLGATGAGKSTLLSLIPRFYDATVGRVLIDGHDVRSLDLRELRRAIGVVFQESFLFSNTIAANIAFGHPEATREQIQQAARIAAAAEFIERLPDGYDTVLGEYGQNLSGGQRQRLAIARAVLLDPPILLLDDPAAAIDARTEHEILQALEQATVGRTTIVIAHRLSTLRNADHVIVLEQGRVTQQGRHEELLLTSDHYRAVAESQLDAADAALLAASAASAASSAMAAVRSEKPATVEGRT